MRNESIRRCEMRVSEDDTFEITSFNVVVHSEISLLYQFFSQFSANNFQIYSLFCQRKLHFRLMLFVFEVLFYLMVIFDLQKQPKVSTRKPLRHLQTFVLQSLWYEAKALCIPQAYRPLPGSSLPVIAASCLAVAKHFPKMISGIVV